MNKDLWIKDGIDNGYFYLLILQDLEDKQFYPVYFQFYSDAQRYQDNIISETKIKIIDLIKLKTI